MLEIPPELKIRPDTLARFHAVVLEFSRSQVQGMFIESKWGEEAGSVFSLYFLDFGYRGEC